MTIESKNEVNVAYKETNKIDEDFDIYTLYGLNTAMHLLRPGAKWEIAGRVFTKWDDPRPCPTFEEVEDTMKKIKEFENQIHTIWLPDQVEIMKQNDQLVQKERNKNKSSVEEKVE